MDTNFGESLLFFSDLAWKCRYSLPLLISTVFLIFNVQMQIEINVNAGPMEDIEGFADAEVFYEDTDDEDYDSEEEAGYAEEEGFDDEFYEDESDV